MAETLRIEIPIETVDNTDPGVSNATKKFEKMERAANSANSSAKKASDTVSKFDKQAQKTEKSLASWAKEKYEVLLEAKERISPVLSTLGNGLRGFAGKTWSVTMRAIDLITSPVRGIINLLKNPIFQVGAVLGVSIGLKDTIETYKDFEAAMSQVQAISGATSTELITKERDTVLDLCQGISRQLRMGNTVFPEYYSEFIERRLQLDRAMEYCNALQDELQFIAETIPCDKNKYMNIVLELNKLYNYIKSLRASDNKFLPKIKKNEGNFCSDCSSVVSAAYFANVNSNGNANYNNASNVNGVRPDFTNPHDRT